MKNALKTDQIIVAPRLDAKPVWSYFTGDCRETAIAAGAADFVFTSPPYFNKLDYGFAEQLGREKTVAGYAEQVARLAGAARDALTERGSLLVNVADSVVGGEQVDVVGAVAAAIRQRGFKLRQKIVWVKPHRKPQPLGRRLLAMDETLLHFSTGEDYYTDVFGLKETLADNRGGNGNGGGNVWLVETGQDAGEHPCPFPVELARRAILLGCPAYVCDRCRRPLTRVVGDTDRLDESRWQARRARQIYEDSGLEKRHLAAVRAVGLSDSPKVGRQQTGAGKNAAATERLAAEAKRVLGSYAREFLMTIKETRGWRRGCDCRAAGIAAGRVYDPCAGAGATLRAASELNRSAIGSDRRLYEGMRHFLVNRKQSPLFL